MLPRRCREGQGVIRAKAVQQTNKSIRRENRHIFMAFLLLQPFSYQTGQRKTRLITPFSAPHTYTHPTKKDRNTPRLRFVFLTKKDRNTPRLRFVFLS